MSFVKSSLDYVAVLSNVAKTTDRVLLLGDMGSGQAVAAFTMHRGSPRKDEAFEVVRCTGLSDQQFSQELFGLSDSAGTPVREGALAKAEGGTLCLIGVDDLSATGQAMLVRALEESSYYPVGSTQPTFFDVRVIAAPTQSLRGKIQSGEFRLDLYHLLGEQIINIPSLNERKGELPQLVADQLRDLNAEDKRFTAGAIECLRMHKFTGGFRELRNILKRAITWFEADVIDESMLNFILHDGREESAARSVGHNDFRAQANIESNRAPDIVHNAGPAKALSPALSEALSLKEQERRYWQGLMERVHGNKQKAADIAGISLRTLYRRLESAGL